MYTGDLDVATNEDLWDHEYEGYDFEWAHFCSISSDTAAEINACGSNNCTYKLNIRQMFMRYSIKTVLTFFCNCLTVSF